LKLPRRTLAFRVGKSDGLTGRRSNRALHKGHYARQDARSGGTLNDDSDDHDEGFTRESPALAAAAPTGAVTVSTHGAAVELPAPIVGAGHHALEASFEFFTARTPNAHTRAAYGRAVARFWDWAQCDALPLRAVSSVHVAAYLDALAADGLSLLSIKQQFAAIRHWLDWRTRRGVLPFNPAAAVRGPRCVRTEAKTPAFERGEARHLLASLAGDDVVTPRDRALIALMLYKIPRVGAAAKMQPRAFDDWITFHGKRGKTRRLEAHHHVREALRVHARRWHRTRKSRATRSAPRHAKTLSAQPMHRNDVTAMVKRRCAAPGLALSFPSHSVRTTGATLVIENGGDLATPLDLLGQADVRPTRVYVRSAISGRYQEVERVQL
jgi:site-specific recombinase XerD